MMSLIALALATTTTSVPLQPIEKWFVDSQDNMCLASRTFGTTENPTVFALKPSILVDGAGQTLFILTANGSGPETRRGTATITSTPSGEERQINYVSWVPKSSKYRAYQLEGDAELTAVMAQAAGLSVVAGKDEVALATGPFQPAMDALKKCNDALFNDWGLDRSARAKPLGGTDPADWFPQNIYPAEAKRKHLTGRSVIILTVAPDGRPTECRVVVKAAPILDDRACELGMKNGRFEPAVGSGSRYTVLGIRWELWGQ